MKKLLAGILSLVCALGYVGLVACGGTENGGNSQQGGSNNQHSHSLTEVKGNDATCTDDGEITYYTCGGCDKWFSDKDGKNEITDKTSVILPKGHKLELNAEVKPTCTKSGNKAYYICSDCGKWYSDAAGNTEITDKNSVYLSRNGHNYENKICTVCNSHEPTANLKYTVGGQNYSVAMGLGTATDTEIYISEEYMGLPVIRVNGFEDCVNITDVHLPETITEIGLDAFKGCTSLVSINIPDSVTSVLQGAFKGCSALIKTEGGVHYVDKWVVGCDKNVTEVTLRADTKGIANWAFRNCVSLTGVTIPDSVTVIGEYAFAESGIAKVRIGDGVTNIDSNAFASCENLDEVILGNKVEVIGWSAFSDCTTLKNINIPDSVTTIRPNAFRECNNLFKTENGIRYVGKWAVDCEDSVTQVTFKNDTVGIAQQAFDYKRNITGAVIPDSVKYVNEQAFRECNNLTNVTIGKGVKVIDKNVFCDCSNLSNVVFGTNLTAIDEYAFKGCEKLNAVTFGSGLTSIGKYAFYCLTDITFEGTKAQWKAVSKGFAWNNEKIGSNPMYKYDYTVHCSDGDIVITKN